MKLFLILFVLFGVLIQAHSSQDKSVRWGYKVIYDSNLKPQEIKNLRKILKLKEVSVLYPPEKNWNLPTGFLSVSSYLEEAEIKALSPSIKAVESAEKTHLLKLTLRNGIDAKELQKIVVALPKYKIQLLTREEDTGPVKLTVKTVLAAEQVKVLSDLGPLIDSIAE